MAEAFGRRLEGTGLTRIQWVALYYMSIHEKINQRDLSKLMNVNDSSIGRLIDRMQRDGLVERIKDDHDRRVFDVILTEKGRTIIEDSITIGSQFSDDLIEGLSHEDVETFERVLETMVKNVCEEDD